MTQAANRAGAIVTDQIRAMMSAAEKQAKEVHRLAEEDAAAVRNDAVADAAKLFEKIEALERPLSEFVAALRNELDALGREFASRGATLGYPPAEAGADAETTDAEPSDEESRRPSAATRPSAAVTVEAAEDADAAEQAKPAAEARDEQPADRPAEAQDEQPASAQDEQPASAQDEQPASAQDEQPAEATERQAAEAAAPPVSDRDVPKPARTGLLRRRKLFITTPGQCAVCHTSFAAGSKDALTESGWQVHGELGLCPQCQSEGWLLPVGGGLPHRRGGRPH